MAAREDSGSVTWWSVFLQSWASSTLDVYERHLRNIRQRSLLASGRSSTQILQNYLLELFRGRLTSSDMRQAISACRMLEEMGIANNFVPRAVWRAVRAKDRCSKFKARGWGSLAAIWTMAQAAESDEDLLVCTSAILATAFCLRISESASIRVQDLDPNAATVSYFDRKTRRCWITWPASTYIVKLMGFARAAALRLGRKPTLGQGGRKSTRSIAGETTWRGPVQPLTLALLEETWSNVAYQAWSDRPRVACMGEMALSQLCPHICGYLGRQPLD